MTDPDRDVSQVEEALTVIAAQEGDGEAFRRLVNRYDPRLLYFIRRIVGETEAAFDVLQAVWLAVHRRLRSLKSPEAFRVWVYRIAHDQAVSQVRADVREKLMLSTLQDRATSDTVDDQRLCDNAELVHHALERLSMDHRRVLTLFFLEEMRIDEIASVLNCPPGTVKSRLSAAKRALHFQIERQIERAGHV